MPVFAEMPRRWGQHEVFGFDSPSAGPLLVVVVSAGGSGVTAGVFDAIGGDQLAWWGTGVQLTGGVVGSHVYESAEGPVLVLAADRHPVRQWLLPEGRPVGPVIEPGGNSRAVDSYRYEDRTVLVIADAQGLLHRFDAATGEVVGEPVSFGPPVPRRRLTSRLLGHAESGVVTFPGSLVADATGFAVTDRVGHLWAGTYASGTATAVPLDVRQGVWFAGPDPRGRENVVLVAGPGFAGFCDTVNGGFVTPPARFVSDPASEEPDGVVAVAAGDQVRIFVAVDGGILRFTEGQECGPHRVYADDEECGPHRLLGPRLGMADNDYLETLCAVRVGERVALFAADQQHIYRLDTL